MAYYFPRVTVSRTDHYAGNYATVSDGNETYTTQSGEVNSSVSVVPYELDAVASGTSFTFTAYSSPEYKFKEWKSSVSGTRISTDNPLIKVVNRTSNSGSVYAHAVFVKKSTFTVTFKDHLGNTLKEVSVLEGESVKAEDVPTPTRTGYTFAGWDGPYDNVTQSITLTAEWETNSYDLSIRFGTGISTVYAKSEGSGSWLQFDGDGVLGIPFGMKWYAYAVAESGYTYTATSASSPMSGTMGESGASFSPVATPTKYTFTVDPNGGTYNKSTSPTVYPSTGSVALTTGARAYRYIAIATRTGYTLDGYYDQKSGGEKVFDANGRAQDGTYWDGTYAGGGADEMTGFYRGAKNLTVYARWTEVLYTVEFSPYGWFSSSAFPGKCTPPSAKGGVATAVSEPLAEREGFTFAGWFDDTRNKGNPVSFPLHPTSGMTVYADWTQKDYILTINPNGGSFPGAAGNRTQTIRPASSTGSKLSVPTFMGHTFVGYFDAEKGGIQTHNNKGEWQESEYYTAKGVSSGVPYYRKTSDLTIYAHWSVNQYKITVSLPSQANGAGSNVVGDFRIKENRGKEYTADLGTTVTLHADDDLGGDAKFLGWYYDDACTRILSKNKEVTVRVGDGYANATYYAKYGTTISFKKDRGGSARLNASIFVDGTEFQSDNFDVTVALGSRVRVRAAEYNGSFFGGWWDWDNQVNQNLPKEFVTKAVFSPSRHCLRVLDKEMQIYVALHCYDRYGTTVQNAILTASGNLEEIDHDKYAPSVDVTSSSGDGAYYRLNGPQTIQVAYSVKPGTTTSQSFRDIVIRRNGKDEYVTFEKFANIPIFSNTVIVAMHGAYTRHSIKCSVENDTFKGVAFVSVGGDVETPTSDPNGSSATCTAIDGRSVTITASSVPGYEFKGWFSGGAQVFGTPTVTFDADKNYDLYAKFESEPTSIFRWQGSGVNKKMRWSAKKMVGSVPFNPSCARIDATGYPVRLDVSMTSSPDKASARTCKINVMNQDARRLNLMRPERYMDIAVESDSEVDAVFVGTSMTGIRT